MKTLILALSLLSLPAFASRYTVESAVNEARYQARHCSGNAMRSFDYGRTDGGLEEDFVQERYAVESNQCDRVLDMRLKEFTALLKEVKSTKKLEGALALQRGTKELILEKKKECLLDTFEKGVAGDIGGDSDFENKESRGYSACHLQAKQRLDRLNAGHFNAANTAEVSHDIKAESLLDQIDKSPVPAAEAVELR